MSNTNLEQIGSGPECEPFEAAWDNTLTIAESNGTSVKRLIVERIDHASQRVTARAVLLA